MESKNILKSIFGASSDGIICVDLKGNILFANTSFIRMLGYFPEEINGKNISKLLKGENIFSKFMLENESDEKFYEMNFLKKSGEVISFQTKTWRQISGLSEATTWLLIKEMKYKVNNCSEINGIANIIAALLKQCNTINACLKNLNQDLGGNIEDVDDYISFASESCANIKDLLDKLSQITDTGLNNKAFDIIHKDRVEILKQVD